MPYRLKHYLTKIVKNRRLILTMSLHDLSARYAGTMGGLTWAILQPLAIVVVYWMVFSLGFRAVGPDNIPFLVYFLPAFVAWSFFNDSILASTSSIVGQPHLIKNIVFPSEILPIINIISALAIHGVMVGIAIVFNYFHGYQPSYEKLPLLIYFLFAQSTLTIGLAWLVSSLNVLHRDVGQFVIVIMNLWFWLTPIIWPMSLVPEKYHALAIINPMLYIVEGYRWVLVDGYPAIIDLKVATCFWAITLVTLLLGVYVFRRLKPEFADVL